MIYCNEDLTPEQNEVLKLYDERRMKRGIEKFDDHTENIIKELEKKEAEEWLLFDQDDKSITELKSEKTVRDKKENRKENIDMNKKMMKENPVTESNESIENKMYDVYIPCFLLEY